MHNRQDPDNPRNAAEFVYDMWRREAMEHSRPHAKRIIRTGFTFAALDDLEKDDHGAPCSLCQALRDELTYHTQDSRQLRLPFPPAPIGPIGEDLLD